MPGLSVFIQGKLGRYWDVYSCVQVGFKLCRQLLIFSSCIFFFSLSAFCQLSLLRLSVCFVPLPTHCFQSTVSSSKTRKLSKCKLCASSRRTRRALWGLLSLLPSLLRAATDSHNWRMYKFRTGGVPPPYHVQIEGGDKLSQLRAGQAVFGILVSAESDNYDACSESSWRGSLEVMLDQAKWTRWERLTLWPQVEEKGQKNLRGGARMAKRKPEGLPYARQNRLVSQRTSGRACKHHLQESRFGMESNVWNTQQ